LVGTLDKPYDPLLGRKTYDIFARHWPNVPADDPIGPVFTKAKKHVNPGLDEIRLGQQPQTQQR
jgi:hypothetical protein